MGIMIVWYVNSIVGHLTYSIQFLIGGMPTAISVPTTSTELLQCYFCAQTTDEACDKYQSKTTCSIGEVCAVVKKTLPQKLGGTVTKFQRGCLPSNCSDSNECHGSSGGECIRCCNSSLCNNYPIPTPPAEPRRQCYVCSQSNRKECDKNLGYLTCSVGEVCRVVVNRLPQVLGGSVEAFQRDCITKADCVESDDCRGDFGGNCIRCCDSDFCNDGDFNRTTGEFIYVNQLQGMNS